MLDHKERKALHEKLSEEFADQGTLMGVGYMDDGSDTLTAIFDKFVSEPDETYQQLAQRLSELSEEPRVAVIENNDTKVLAQH